MVTQVIQYKDLDSKYKELIQEELEPSRTLYLVKDNNSNIKSITTSVIMAIKKTQVISK
jgi:hypothetical protein